MLSKANLIPNLAVKNLDTAKRFYSDTLGLKKVKEMEGEVATYKSGDTQLYLYKSEFAGTNEATAATWVVDDVEKEVSELKKKGVSFEHYDMPGLSREGDVHVGGDMKIAWFKDPDGNILSLVNAA